MTENEMAAAEPNASDGKKPSRQGKLKKSLKRLLDLPASDEKLRALGLPPEETDNYMLVALAVFQKAAAGDIKFVQELRHIIGDNETDLDRRTNLAQLEKIRAQTEEIRHKMDDGSDGDDQLRRELIDVLNGAAADWDSE